MKKAETIYYIKQKLSGLTMAAIGIITPILLDGDCTFSLIALPLGIWLLFTKEKVMMFWLKRKQNREYIKRMEKIYPLLLLKNGGKHMNKTIMQIATEKHINKVCIDGMVKDIRQLDKKPFEAIPERVEVMKNSIYNEPILFCYC